MVNWNLLDEPWIELGDWLESGSGNREINPPGQLHHTGDKKTYKVLPLGLPDIFTLEFRQAINIHAFSLNTGGFNGVDNFTLMIFPAYIEVFTNSGSTKYYIDNIVNVWYIWRLECDSKVGGEMTVYRDDVPLTTFTDVKDRVTNDGQVYIQSYTFGELHQDYIRIAAPIPFPLVKTKMSDKGMRGVLREI